jgi:hypothetical protein
MTTANHNHESSLDASAVAHADLAEWAQRVRAEYLEFPTLSLTAAQVQRLWNLDSETCRLVLDKMVRETFLRRTPRAQFVRRDWCRSDDPDD